MTRKLAVVAARKPTSSRSEGANNVGARSATGYQKQLDHLAVTYRRLLKFDPKGLTEGLERVAKHQAIYVGSGGARAVAQLAADLHESRQHVFARAVTPLEMVGLPPLFDTGVVMFSASGRHPDAGVALSFAVSRHADPIVVVTHRHKDKMPAPFAADNVEVVTLPNGIGKEGFLATNSVLAMGVATIRGFGYGLPPELPHLTLEQPSPVRRNCVILGGPGLSAASIDLETRLAETGLSQAQVTDYRNFAHGRHHGLSRQLADTTVIALVMPRLRDLADATLATLPGDTHVIRLESELEWPAAALDLLVASMKLIGTTARESQIDPSRPRVPPFGRKLYHLSSRRLFPADGRDAIDRKLAAARLPSSESLRTLYSNALADWLEQLESLEVGGLVLDYDGTVCSTHARFELPEEPVRNELVRLVETGVRIGFASGRGGSLHRDLRAWLPRPLWSEVKLGLYNGGALSNLNDSLEEQAVSAGELADAYARLQESPVAEVARIEQRAPQITIESTTRGGLPGEALSRLVSEVIARAPALPLKVIASAHSVDVIPAGPGKSAVIDAIANETGQGILAIGDQGQIGGNDFELLAATPWSLSVDRVSADPTRCWNLDASGLRGPRLLERYLAAIARRRGHRVQFRWRR